MHLAEKVNWQPKWKIFKFEAANDMSSDEVAAAYWAGDRSFQPFEIVDIPGNLLLNGGITALLDLISGNGTPTAFNNANARIGVGDSSTVEAATQTGLQAATNKTYKAMDATYPTVTAQTIMFQATFGGTDANYAWNEFIVDNGATALVALNRKVSAQGTKASGQTWTLQLSITIS